MEPVASEAARVDDVHDTSRAAGTVAPRSSLPEIMRVAGGSDPTKLAAAIVQMGRQNDAELWTEIQQQLGNGRAQQIRAAMNLHAPATETAAATPVAADAAGDDAVLAAPRIAEFFGIRVIASAGVHARAIDACREFIADEIGNSPQIQKRMTKAKVTIVIIPAKVPMTDVSQFKSLATPGHNKTFDGRDWSSVRGSGGMETPDGDFSIAIAEENLVQIKGALSAYPATYSIGMHEFAHSVEAEGLLPAQRARIVALYNAHKARDPGDKNDTWTDSYSSDNELEYFAQCTNAFFGKNAMTSYHNGPERLKQQDPDMFAFLTELYSGAGTTR
jgi:hypothetical protein